jgi:hypothetical protein
MGQRLQPEIPRFSLQPNPVNPPNEDLKLDIPLPQAARATRSGALEL